MADLYEDLGVSEDASKEEIKAMFRALAQKHHPDRGGDVERCKALTVAYDILSDPERRKHYNATGETKKRDLRAEAETTVANLFVQAAEAEDTPEYADILKNLHATIVKQENAIREAQRKMLVSIGKLNKVIKRTVRKNDHNMAVQVMTRRVAELEKLANKSDIELALADLIYEVIDTYEYAFDTVTFDYAQPMSGIAWKSC